MMKKGKIEKSKFGHLMLDLETMGVDSGSAITAIAAIEFNIETGQTGASFYHKISLQSCVELGLKIDGRTVQWWLMQNEEARKEMAKDGIPIIDGLQKFSEFFSTLPSDIQIWGNGARFDMGILSDAYIAAKSKIPWKFKNERDVRTLVSIFPTLKWIQPMNGTAHNALDDCKHQINYCSKIWKKIK